MFDRNTSDRIPPIWIYTVKHLIQMPLVWILPAAALGLTLLTQWQPSSLYWTAWINAADGLLRLLWYTGWFVMLCPLCLLLQSQRGAEGIDPAAGTGYPAWKILLSKSLCAWTLLGIFAVSMTPYFFLEGMGSHPHFDLRIFLCWLIALSEVLLLLADLGRTKAFVWVFAGLGLTLLFFLSMIDHTIVRALQPMQNIFCLAILAVGCRIGNAQYPTANRAFAPRLAILIAVLLKWFTSDSDQAVSTGELPALLMLVAALWERRMPGRMQLAQLPSSMEQRAALLPLQSGVLPGLATGTILLGILTALGDGNFLPWGFLLFYLQAALLLNWKCKMPVLAAMIVLSIALQVLPLILLVELDGDHAVAAAIQYLNPESDFWLGLSPALRNGAAVLIALLGALPVYPLYRDYCKAYFARD